MSAIRLGRAHGTPFHASIGIYLLLFVTARTYLIVKNIVGMANKPVEGFGLRGVAPTTMLGMCRVSVVPDKQPMTY